MNTNSPTLPPADLLSLRIRVAEAEGWTRINELNFAQPCGYPPNKSFIEVVPPYSQSRDAIVAAALRRFGTMQEREKFENALLQLLPFDRNIAFALATADAATLCQAYLAAELRDVDKHVS